MEKESEKERERKREKKREKKRDNENERERGGREIKRRWRGRCGGRGRRIGIMSDILKGIGRRYVRANEMYCVMVNYYAL